jgi:concentrative nucleoside transporter, CNT family
MNPESPAPSAAPPPAPIPPTPLSWRLGIAVAIVVLGLMAYWLQSWIGPRGVSGFGVICFLGLVAVFSTNLRAVKWRTIGSGILLQVLLALFIIKLEIFGVAPGRMLFQFLGEIVKYFLDFTLDGCRFVFGVLADKGKMGEVFGPGNSVIIAFAVLPTVIFVSAVFSVLYHYGILQRVVAGLSWVMQHVMGTSGAETLSVGANVFIGQTEAPLIVKPYIARMTDSELMSLMLSGMAHIAGGVMAVYIGFGADPVAILASSVMAAPCSLYLTKLLIPETGRPETLGGVRVTLERPHSSGIDAFAGGTIEGLRLFLNIIAMLIAFLAALAMVNFLLGQLGTVIDYWLPGLVGHPLGVGDDKLSLGKIFSWVFSPLAFLLGVDPGDVGVVAKLLGLKLSANEFIAYLELQRYCPPDDVGAWQISKRSHKLATYALAGFANFGSIGIQLGGIGALAPERRKDLARLSFRALFGGFLATLINGAMAGMLLDD